MHDSHTIASNSRQTTFHHRLVTVGAALPVSQAELLMRRDCLPTGQLGKLRLSIPMSIAQDTRPSDSRLDELRAHSLISDTAKQYAKPQRQLMLASTVLLRISRGIQKGTSPRYRHQMLSF